MNEVYVGTPYVSKAHASRLLDISRQAVTLAVKKERVPFVVGEGIPTWAVEKWRKNRIKEASDELVIRQSVPRIVY